LIKLKKIKYDTLNDFHKSKIKIQKKESSRFSQVLRRTGTDGSHEKRENRPTLVKISHPGATKSVHQLRVGVSNWCV
jgi:hypothetical protein